MDWKLIISELSSMGATQIQMAERADCGQSTISEISRGEIKNPGASIALALLAMRDELRSSNREAA